MSEMVTVRVGDWSTDAAAVVFDKDGTLLDLDAAWADRGAAWCRHLADLASDPSLADDLARELDLDLDPPRVHPGGLLAAGTVGQTVERVQSTLSEAGHVMSVTEIVDVFATGPAEIAPLGDVKGTVERMHAAGLGLAVLTSDDHDPTRIDLLTLGIADLIHVVCGADDVQRPKPDPEGFLRVADLLGVKPADAIMVGDSPGDAAAARAAGAGAFIAIASGPDRDRFDGSADAVVGSIDELRF